MKTVVILSIVFGVAFCVPVAPVVKIDSQVPANFQVATSNPVDVARRRRHIFDLDVDIYNNNGFGYFDNGNDFYGGYGGYGGGYGGFPGGYGGYGGYPGYGGFGGYPGYGYGGFGGYPGYGGYGGYGGFGPYF